MSQSLIFVDSNVTDYQNLLSAISGTDSEVILIDGQKDGLQQMADALAGRTGLDAIHVFSHGSAGALQLGDITLTNENLNHYATQLTQIGQSLTETGDILLYGCNVGADATGQAFVESIARITQADVAASDDLTGAADKGGDWVLEYESGFIAAESYFDTASLASFQGSLAASLVKDINSGAGSSNLASTVNVNDVFFFSAYTATDGVELWKSDGTTGGTVLLKDIVSGTGSSSPSYLTNANGTLFFAADDGTNGLELWKSDGTAAGTLMVKNINTTATTGSQLGGFFNWNGTLFFKAMADNNTGLELWKSDGTAAGTVLVKDIHTGVLNNSTPNYLTLSNNILFFSAYDSATNVELWKTDGTTAGTVKVKEINSTGGSSPAGLCDVNGTLFFVANDGLNGYELWKSDGTDAGTVMVKDIAAGAANSASSYLTNVNGTLFFTANDGINGSELWKSDGTEAGTVMVKNIAAGAANSAPSYLTNVNGTLFFVANDGLNGGELWKSDGTDAGTVMVKNIAAGATASNPNALYSAGGKLYFSATDGTNGYEPWVSDGTDAGTVMVEDINPGASSSSPSAWSAGNGILLFKATSAANGAELYSTSIAIPNAAPTLTTMSNISGATEDTQFQITFSDLQGAGNDDDTDGTVDAFVVQAVSSGTLKIGADAGSATAYDASTNNTIDATHQAFWTPAANANGTLQAFTVKAKDNAGATSATAIPLNVVVTAVADAPVLDNTKSPALTTIAEDAGNPVNGSTTGSTQVSTLIASGGIANFSDADGDSAGLAITGINANGSLWYSTNNGTTWTQATGISASNALPLASSALVYFAPNANYSGSLSDAITFRAWDGTSGTSGAVGLDANSTVSLSMGGATASGAISSSRSIDGSGNYLCVTDSGSLKVIDISNPAAPSVVGTVNTSGAEMVAVSGNYAYVAAWNSGLKVVDISTPASPAVAGSYTAGMSSIGSVAVSGNYAYLASVSPSDLVRFYIFDVTTPTSPVLASTLSMGTSYARDIYISGDRAYLTHTDDTDGLQVIDISNPNNPQKLGGWAGVPSYSVVVSGNYAYLGTTTSSGDDLRVLDISDPAHITEVATLNTSLAGPIYDLTLSGTKLYAAHDSSGVQVIDISNPTSPVLEGPVANTPGVAAWSTVLIGDKIYVADGNAMQVITATQTVGSSLSSAADTVSLTITPVADTPSVTNATTTAATQTTSGLVLSRNAADGAEVTHFKITSITNGNLFKNDGTTAINNGDFITYAEGNAGLKFTPTGGGNGSFVAQASTSNADGGLGGSTVTADILLPLAMVNLSGDSVAWAGIGNTVVLDASANATVSDATHDGSNWNGVTLTVQRSGTAVTSDLLAIADGSGYTVSGSNLQAGGQTFATFTSANGLLTVTFANGGADATNALVQDVVRHITYRNDTPAGNATLRFSLDDGTNSSTADVTVTTDKIYVTHATDTASVDLNANGVSFSEGIAIAATQAGTQTLVLGSALAGQTVSTASASNLGENITLDADAASGATLTGGTLDTNGNTLTVTNGTGDTLSIATTLSGTGGISKTGAGTATVSGTNSYSGATSVTGGTIIATNADSLGTSAVTLDGGKLSFGSGNITLANAIALGNSGGTLQTGSTLHTHTLSGVISGSGNLTLAYTTGALHSMLALSGANTYTGTTTLNLASSGGVLQIAGDANLGTGAIIFNSGRINVTGDTVIDNAIQAASGTASFTVASGKTAEMTGVISGGSLSLGGSGGTSKLSGTNTYAGSTYSGSGHTIIANNEASLPDATLLELGGASLTLAGSHQTIGSLNTNTAVSDQSVIDLGAFNLTLDSNSASKFAGAINGSGTLIKNGSGTFTVSSDSATANGGTHSGKTVINGGVLQLDGTLKGGVDVASGGKLAGGGASTAEGEAIGTVQVGSGGTLSPGVSGGSGVADIKTGNLAIASGGTLALTLNGATTPGTDYDQIITTGSVNISGATLSVTGSATPGVGTVFTLVDNDGADAVTGTFNGLAEGDTVTVNGTAMKLSYIGGTGNDITLTAQMGFSGLAFSADTGTAGDFVTNATSQTISATLSSALGALTIWGSLDNGVNWTEITSKVSGTTLSWDGVTLTGSDTLKLEARNGATVVGNTSQAFTLDTTAPTTIVNSAALSADTGTSSTDFITKTAAQTISGTLNAVTVAGEKVQVSLDNGNTWVDADNTIGQNSWSLAGQTLSGSSTMRFRVVDLAGNAGTEATQAFVLDTTAPVITFSALALSADTGTSSTDFNTATANQTITATLSGAPAGTDKVYGSLDNGNTWTDITAKVAGTTLTWDGVTLAGSSSIKLKVTDNAANDGTVATQAFVLDTAAPTASITTANVGIGSNVTTSQSTETGTIYLVKTTDTPTDQASLETLVTGGTATKATVTATGTNTPIATTGLIAGTYKVYSVDAAGNVSAASGNTITLGTAPTTTVATAVFSADSGSSSTDFITKTAAQTISGTLSAVTVAGETVEVSLDNGTTWTTATNNIGESTWTLAGQTLTASNTLQARITSAGFSSNAYSHAYILDTTAPTSSVTTATVGVGANVSTAQSTETGTLYLVNTTDTPTDQASLEALVTGGTATKATVTASGTNTTVATTGLTAGTYKIYSVDAAGNVSAASGNTITLTPNALPTLGSIPGTTQGVTTGVAAALPDFTVADTDGSDTLTLTLTATNGSIGGLTDADPGTAGIQLTGTAAQINTALADALFTATANGAASIGFSLSDGVAVPVTGTYNLNATTPPADPPVVPPAAPGATITNPDGTTTTIPTGTGGTTSITSPAPGSTVTITGSGDTTVTSPGPTVTLNNTGTGTVTTTGFTGGSTLNVTGTGSQHIDMTGLQPGDVITINNTGSGTVDLSNLPDGVVVNIVGTGPVVLNDNDGTSASVESMVPSLLANGVTGDGNGDGTPDALQSNVASVPFLETSTAVSNPAGAPPVFISLVADSKDGMIDTTNNLTATLSNVQQLDAPANLPADLQMPLGLISFDSTINIVGATETFSLFVDSSISLNGYWKQNAAGVWCNLATTIVTEGGKTRLDFAITDGGEFDADGIANGVIVDPGAVGSMPQSIVGISAVANNTGFWF